MFLGKRPVARVSAHPPIFAAELQAPIGAYPADYSTCVVTCTYLVPIYPGWVLDVLTSDLFVLLSL